MPNRIVLCVKQAVASLTLTLIAAFAIGCGTDSTPLVPSAPGKLIGHDSIKTYDSQVFERIRSIGLDDFFKNSTMTAHESVIPELNNQKV